MDYMDTSDKVDVKQYIRDSPFLKKFLWIFLTIAAPSLIIFTVVYAFTFHGMLAMYEWIIFAKIAVVLIIIIAIFIPILAILDVRIAKNSKRMGWIKKKFPKFRLPSRALWAILIFWTIVPLGLISWVQISSIQKGDKAPQLIISDNLGTHGIPNLGVVFWTDEPVATELTWGYGGNTFTLEESVPKNEHVFILDNLYPTTKYWYEIEYTPYSDITYNFTTATNSTETLKFAVSSDCHISAPRSYPESTQNVIEQIVHPPNGIDYFFQLGDIVEFGFDDANWKDAADYLSPYFSQLPTRWLIGNHDAMFAGAEFYKDYFSPTELITRQEEGATEFYQRIDINNIHFIILDLEWGTSETYFGEQETWLKEQLESIDENDWTIVMSHTFYYARGSYSEGTPWFDNPETIEHLVPLFEDNDVDMVFSGHIHDMQHLVKNNVSYSIVGGMGGYHDPDWDEDSDATTLFFDNVNFGYMEIDIAGNVANLTYFDEFGTSLYDYLLYR